MDPAMPMPSGEGAVLLDPSEFDMNNETQAMDFLNQLLDDSTLQYDAQKFTRYFWYGIVVVIGVFMILYAFRKFHSILRQRVVLARTSNSAPRGERLRSISIVVSGICQLLVLPQITPSRAKFWFRVPPLGIIFLIVSYLGFVIALEFINNDVPGAQYWTSLGIRAGWLTIAQVPLLILLTAKNNLIGLMVGLSYERLNVLHRWVARTMLLMAIMHLAFQDHAWIIYGVRSLEWATDECVPTGFATFALLVWMNVSTVLPLRNWWYEFFVIQHLLTFFGFIIAIMYHLPDTALETRTYIWISIGLYLFDRVVRTAHSAWNNSSRVQASVVPLGDACKVEVEGSRLRNWSPGSFVLLSIPHFGPLQSHPATILSTPSSHEGNLVFLLKAQNGFTKKLLSSPMVSEPGSDKSEVPTTYRAFVDGPYGGTQRDFAVFNTAVLMAGSTGITFILSLLQDISSRASRGALSMKRLEVVWAIRHRAQLAWAASELQKALQCIEAAGIDVKLAVHVTRDDHERQDDPGAKVPEPHEADANMLYTSIKLGRPRTDAIISESLSHSTKNLGIAICGPLSWSSEVRRIVAARSVTAKSGIYLHVEGFSW